MHKTRHIIFLMVVAISFVLASCSSSKVETVRKAEQKWLKAGVIKYQMTITKTSSWLIEEYEVVVENDKVKLVRYKCTPGWLGMETAICDGNEKYTSQLDTVGEIFDRAESWVAENDGKNLQIRFDVIYGYPTYMEYDNPEHFDEEMRIDVSIKVLK